MGEQLADPSDKNLTIALVLAYAVPGAGHFYLGRRAVGVLLFVAIASTFLFGFVSSKGRAVHVTKHPYALAAQLGAGLMTIVPAIHSLVREPLRPEGERPPDHEIPLYAELDLGLLFTMVAGILNLILVHNVTAGRFGRVIGWVLRLLRGTR